VTSEICRYISISEKEKKRQHMHRAGAKRDCGFTEEQEWLSVCCGEEHREGEWRPEHGDLVS
jgi:hypothetical protein